MIGQRNDKWFVTVYDPQTRAKVWIGTYRTERDAKRAERDAQIDMEENASRRSVASFAEAWTDPAGPYARKAESTNLLNAERVKAFVDEHGHRALASFNRAEARTWAFENRWRYPSVRAMFSDAMADGLVRSNPFIGLRLPVHGGTREHVPSEHEVRQLARFAGECHATYGRTVYGPMILFAAYTGLRPGELYGLEWDDIDLAAGVVTVNRQFNQRTRVVTPPKWGSARTVPLLPQAATAFDRVARTPAPWVFSTPQGKRFSGRVQSYYWRPVRNRLDAGWDFYCLRHAFGTHLAHMGVDAYSIAKVMGHSDGGQTALRHYIRHSEREAHRKIHEAVARSAGSNRGADAG